MFSVTFSFCCQKDSNVTVAAFSLYLCIVARWCLLLMKNWWWLLAELLGKGWKSLRMCIENVPFRHSMNDSWMSESGTQYVWIAFEFEMVFKISAWLDFGQHCECCSYRNKAFCEQFACRRYNRWPLHARGRGEVGTVWPPLRWWNSVWCGCVQKRFRFESHESLQSKTRKATLWRLQWIVWNESVYDAASKCCSHERETEKNFYFEHLNVRFRFRTFIMKHEWLQL